MNQGTLTETWGKTIVAQLIEQGVDYFCLSPGFRSTPLALAIGENPRAQTFVHFDERGTAFHALGYAKATKRPAVMIVTSGTAVGNLMPAVMEAWAAHIPLLLLTCDRPASLRDTMANQTGDQLKIFGDYVHYFCDLPSPDKNIPENFLATTIAQAVARSLFPIKGPVQLNCPFPEPYFSEDKAEALSLKSTQYFPPKLSLENPEKWAKELQKIERGIIVLGGNASASSAKFLSQKLRWPIFPDIASSFRELGDQNTIPYYHHILQSLPDLTAETILHLGDAVVSKVLLHWMGKAERLIHVAEHPKRCDPLHVVTERIICSPELFCKKLSPLLLQKEEDWLSFWRSLSEIAKEQCTFPAYSEPGVIQWLEKSVTPGKAIFFGNSMPIRDADMFFFPQQPCGPIFANRGLSGIDGNIATIAGIAQTMPVIAIMGDQTALHDLNSLAQLKKTRHRVQLIILNNGGGGIFSFVSIHKKKDLLDSFFAASHNRKFAHAAHLFDLSYTLADTAEALESETSIIEVLTDREENLALHQKIDRQMKEALKSGERYRKLAHSNKVYKEAYEHN